MTQFEFLEGGLAGTEASRKVTPAQDDAERHLVDIGELGQREKLGNQVTVTGFSVTGFSRQRVPENRAYRGDGRGVDGT